MSSYEVYINDGSGGAFPDEPTANISDTLYAFSLTNADLGKEYKMEIVAISESGANRTSGLL